jgi:hypothetical protein
LAVNQSFRQGVNFATGRATALDRTFFVERGFNAISPYNISLGDQLGWFDAVKPSLCSSPQGSPHTLNLHEHKCSDLLTDVYTHCHAL